MPNATFDTLKFARTLREAGVPVAQAKAGVLAEIFPINFRDALTKDDLGHAVTNVETKLRETEQRLNVRIDAARNELRETEQCLDSKIDGVRADLNAKIESVKSELRETEQRLNAKIDLVKTDLTAKIDQSKTELNAKIDHNHTKLSADMALLKWMFGLVVTMILGLMGLALRSLIFPAR